MIKDSLKQDAENKKIFENKDLVYISGMGGSGIVGEFVADIFSEDSYKLKTLVLANKSSEASHSILSMCHRTLSIAVSYSGNTGETMAFFKRIIKNQCDIGVVTSGGLLLNEALKRSVPLYRVAQGYPPRASLPMLLSGVLKIIELVRIDLGSVYSDLERASDILSSFNYVSRELAEEIYERITSSQRPRIVVASSNRYKSLVERYQTEFAENSKLYIEAPVFPEAGHNYIETLRGGDAMIYYISDPDDIENQVILGFLKRLSQYNEKIYLREIELPEKERYATKLIVGAYVAGLLTAYLAERFNIDPAEIPVIKIYREHVSSYYLERESL